MKQSILLAILALSINAFAQNSQQPSFNSMVNVRGRMGLTGRTTPDIPSPKIFGQPIKPQKPNQGSLIQIYDSIYVWQWDTISKGWEIYYKDIDYVYNAHYNWASYKQQSWKGSAWRDSLLYTYTYDANNNVICDLIQDWNGSAWVNNWQDIYTYDLNNNVTSDLYKTWNGNGWVNSWQTIYTYDANDNLETALSQNWNGNVWVNYCQNIYTYDVNNNETSNSYKTWYDNAWVNNWQDIYTYDANNFLKIFTVKYWNNAGIEVMRGDSCYNYFHTNLGINELKMQDAGIVVFPNPTSGKFTVSSKTDINAVEVYNLLGERVYHRANFNGRTSTEIDLSNHSKGTYILNVHSGRKVYNCKIVVQ